MKKCRLHMIKQSLLEDDQIENESFLAELRDDVDFLYFQYIEPDSHAKVSVKAEFGVVELRREGEVNSHLMLRLHERTIITIDSAYGQLQMEAYTVKILNSPQYLLIEYQLLQHNEVIGHTQITWQIMEEEIA